MTDGDPRAEAEGASVIGVDPGRPDEISQVRGQANVATTPGEVSVVRLSPTDPPACASCAGVSAPITAVSDAT